MPFHLLGDRIFVIDDEDEDTNEAGLYVPDSGKTIVKYGTVAKVGAGRRVESSGWRLSLDVQEGDRVFYHKDEGAPREVEGQMYREIQQDRIWGVVDE